MLEVIRSSDARRACSMRSRVRRLIAGGIALASADQSHMTRLLGRSFGISPGKFGRASIRGSGRWKRTWASWCSSGGHRGVRRTEAEREMVDILDSVPQHDGRAMPTGVELTLADDVATRTHVLNFLHRLVDGKVP